MIFFDDLFSFIPQFSSMSRLSVWAIWCHCISVSFPGLILHRITESVLGSLCKIQRIGFYLSYEVFISDALCCNVTDTQEGTFKLVRIEIALTWLSGPTPEPSLSSVMLSLVRRLCILNKPHTMLMLLILRSHCEYPGPRIAHWCELSCSWLD